MDEWARGWKDVDETVSGRMWMSGRMYGWEEGCG